MRSENSPATKQNSLAKFCSFVIILLLLNVYYSVATTILNENPDDGPNK